MRYRRSEWLLFEGAGYLATEPYYLLELTLYQRFPVKKEKTGTYIVVCLTDKAGEARFLALEIPIHHLPFKSYVNSIARSP